MTNSQTILKRFRDGLSIREVTDRIYRMRRFLAGDESALGRGSKISMGNLAQVTKQNSYTPDFSIVQHDEGVSNHALTWIRTLVKQVMIRHPEITFDGLPTPVSDFREAYLLDRLSACGWQSQVRSMLHSFFTDGIGVLQVGLKADKPSIRWIDPIRMVWDVHNKFPHNWRWLATELTLTVSTAKAELGADVVNAIRAKADLASETGEEIIKVFEYWDESTVAYISPSYPEPLKIKPNPFGFIPFEFICGDILPSHLTPMAPAVNMLGTHAAHTKIQRSLIEIADKLKPVILVDPSVFTPESYEQFQTSQDLAVLVYRQNLDPDRYPGVQVQSLSSDLDKALALKRELDEEYVRAMGANPYAAGSSINPAFASETQAIVGNSGLTVMDVSNDLADTLSRTFRKLIRIGYLYDEEPFVYRSHETDITFDQQLPIQPLLSDDVMCIVQPSPLSNPEAAIQKAQALYSLFAQDPSIAQKNPELLRQIRLQILSAYNFRGADKLLPPDSEETAKAEMVRDIPLEMLQQLLQMGMQAAQTPAGIPAPPAHAGMLEDNHMQENLYE